MSFGSQVKLALFLVPFTALVAFAIFWSLQLAGAPVGDYESLPMLAAVGTTLAVMIAGIQIAALALVRLLRWQGPSLKIEGDGDDLRRVFE